ncbi:Acg family FMN-binding oxidoreductase [Paractinoplanes atraurantiacus]|uniref:Nitroreductase family protein n=1 Tax=Paractinoplanes atraurantiacus TaxID=1036182 RepID=A0A285JFQ1_9ACTN|nr:nitroreductase family protein [Actinoplanes atraurantiacus]SNY59119.1 Nitroreductase family protein [Actinoplanes atraurantiacus]
MRKMLTEGVRTATSAPSLHNSQPWLFRIHQDTVDVYADPSRRLTVLDPGGREQLISVGAAVFTLRLAVAAAGYRVATELLPDPDEPDLVARVRAGCPARPSRAAEALAAAVPHRHTNRWPFTHTPVPAAVIEHLRDAARREGAVLTVASAAVRDSMLGLARAAERRLRARPGYRDELARWTGQGARTDGVPLWAAGPWDSLETVPIRDFAELAELPRPTERFEPYPTVLVLATPGDERADQLRAGAALQRVLLTATWQNLSTTPIGQLVEVPAVRRALTDPAGGLSAQMVLRVGYGRVVGPTPRRPLTEVLR